MVLQTGPAAACSRRWKRNEGNLGARPAYRLTSRVPAAVLKRLTGCLAPQSPLCKVQLARLFSAKGSYLSANSGWQRWADWGRGVGRGTGREELAEAATEEEGGGAG